MGRGMGSYGGVRVVRLAAPAHIGPLHLGRQGWQDAWPAKWKIHTVKLRSIMIILSWDLLCIYTRQQCMQQELQRNILAQTVRASELHIATGLHSGCWLLLCDCHSVRDRNNLVVLEILGLIFIMTVCIVIAAPIELDPVGALHDAGQITTLVPQSASK